MQRASHHRTLRCNLKMTTRLRTIDAPTAEKRAAQVRRATALSAQELHIRTRARSLSAREKAKPREERRDALARRDIDNVCAAPQLWRALHRDRGLNRRIHRAQKANDTARDGSTCGLKAEPQSMFPIRRHGCPHAQERRKLRRPTTVTLRIRARERILHIRGERWHLSSPESHRSYA